MFIKPYPLLILLFSFISCKQGEKKPALQNDDIISKTEQTQATDGPQNITRNFIEDRNGNVWIAAFDGIFRYDGESFDHISKGVSTARFFSAMEDKSGNLWFGSIGSGLYLYDGNSFKNITSDDGLLNDEVVSIYEDKSGKIWFGTFGGVSQYDGHSFRNFKIQGDSIIEVQPGISTSRDRELLNEVNSIIEDRKGNIWLGTRGRTFIYNGKTFESVTQAGNQFTNVRSMIEDRQGHIWLGGNDGLWRYDGQSYSNITKNFVGYIYEDKKGNIWTSSQSSVDPKWMLTRYDQKSLTDKTPSTKEIRSQFEGNRGMIFGILESNDGTIWVGSLAGVLRYNGHALVPFEANN